MPFENFTLERGKQEVFNILAYAHVFKYPLTKKEIYERGKIEIGKLELYIKELLEDGSIFSVDEFYSLHNDKEITESRRKRNDLANKFMKKAEFMTKIIAHFPFTRGILISGSLSKNCMDENGDIDFFIITKPGRLWITHLFCGLFRKTILFNKPEYLCYNFLIDSEHLAINNKSIYTAIEIKTLIPLYGYDYYIKLLKNNDWINDFFPNLPISPNKDVLKKQSYTQKILESFFNNSFGEWLDKWFLAWSIDRRKKRLDPKLFQYPEFYTNLKRYIAKGHINDNYPNIMKEYNQIIEKYAFPKVD